MNGKIVVNTLIKGICYGHEKENHIHMGLNGSI